MKKLIFILTIGSLVAQYLPPQSEIDNMTTTSKMLLYEMKKLSRIESFFDSEIGLNSKKGEKILWIGITLAYSPSLDNWEKVTTIKN